MKRIYSEGVDDRGNSFVQVELGGVTETQKELLSMMGKTDFLSDERIIILIHYGGGWNWNNHYVKDKEHANRLLDMEEIAIDNLLTDENLLSIASHFLVFKTHLENFKKEIKVQLEPIGNRLLGIRGLVDNVDAQLKSYADSVEERIDEIHLRISSEIAEVTKSKKKKRKKRR